MSNRRGFLMASVAASIVTPWSQAGLSQPTKTLDDYTDAAAANRWMQVWIEQVRAIDPSTTKAPNGALHVGRFADPIYYLTSVIGWNPEPTQASTYLPVRVPIGFVTDFTSIPRVFWSLLRPDGTYSYAAVIHDFLYWEQYLSREVSDTIFKLCMEDFKISTSVVATVYAGVRIGGGSAWEANAKRRAAGERRVIRRFPDDPRLTWADWSRDATVF
jgi:hypothetical protein